MEGAGEVAVAVVVIMEVSKPRTFIVNVFVSSFPQVVEERTEDQVAEDLVAHSVLMCSTPVDFK